MYTFLQFFKKRQESTFHTVDTGFHKNLTGFHALQAYCGMKNRYLPSTYPLNYNTFVDRNERQMKFFPGEYEVPDRTSITSSHLLRLHIHTDISVTNCRSP